MKNKDWTVKELVDGRLVSTHLEEHQAKNLFSKLCAKEIGCILYSHKNGKAILEDSYIKPFESPSIMTSVTNDSFNDHSGLSGCSTMENKYNKNNGRL